MATSDTFEPIVNAGFLYCIGMQLANDATTPTTIIDIQPGQCRDSTNQLDINLGNYLGFGQPQTTANTVTKLNAAVNGANGLDTGSLAVSTWYYVYVIADPTGFKTTATIISKNTPAAGGPLMPFGYGIYRRIGQVLTDGSSHILAFWQAGDQAIRQYMWDAQISLVSSFATASFTAQSLAAGIPDVKVQAVYLNCDYTPGTVTDVFAIRPTGSSVSAANAPIQGNSTVVSKPAYYSALRVIPAFNGATPAQLSVDLFVTSTGDSLNVLVSGYDDYI